MVKIERHPHTSDKLVLSFGDLLALTLGRTITATALIIKRGNS